MVKRETLIAEVRKYTNLYDTRDERHRDTEFRDQCWIEIADKFGNDCEELKREWKILRDSYRQVIKRKDKGLTKANGKKWRYENAMKFLLPFMTERSSGSRLPLDATKPMKADVVNGDQPKPLEAVDVERSECWENAHGSGDNIQVDPLELFFSSVCQSAKRLPKYLQNRVKHQVLDIMMKAEEEEQHMECKVNIFDNL